MDQEIINKVVEEIKKNKVFTTDYIARKLGVEKGVVEKVLGILLAQGKIRRIQLECPCDKCVFSKICGLKYRRKRIIEYYQIVT